LTAKEEKSKLTTHLIDAANGKTRMKVNRMAENVGREKGALHKDKKLIFNRRWRKFIEQQSQLGRFHSSFHMDGISQESISRYFDLL